MSEPLVSCTRRIEFDAGHRVIGHENKCKYLHGHRYVLEVTAGASNLDKLGRVVDFGDLKTIIQGWVDDNWDHTIILDKRDQSLGNFVSNYTGQEVYYMDSNPTAENIALHFRKDIIPILLTTNLFRIIKLKLYETPNCFVELNG